MLKRIEKILKEYTCNNELIVTESTTFAELELDSLDTVELIMSLEDEFGVTIEMSDSLKSVEDLIKAIEAQK